MNAKQFEKIAEARFDHCRRTLLAKGEEYSRGNDRLHNFKTAAHIDGDTPEQALWGMLRKHIVSVRDMVQDVGQGKVPSRKMVDEKLTDWINYGLLLEGLLVERGLDQVTIPVVHPVSDQSTQLCEEYGPGLGFMSDTTRQQVEDLGFLAGKK